jgi:hypothetical protein
MCCKKNDHGGKDCEEVESLKGGVKGSYGQRSGGQLQVAPTNPGPKASPFQKGGMNAPIMRRGVEPPSDASMPSGQTAPDQAGGKKSE